MFNKNKISNKEIIAILDEQTNRLECLLDIYKLQTDTIEQLKQTIETDMKMKLFKFDSWAESESSFKESDIIFEKNNSIFQMEIDEIEKEMDALCGFWKISSERNRSIIMISKLPNREYVFTYHPEGYQSDSFSFIIEDIIEKSVPVTIMDEELAIYYEGETDEHKETIIFDNALYFRTSEL